MTTLKSFIARNLWKQEQHHPNMANFFDWSSFSCTNDFVTRVHILVIEGNCCHIESSRSEISTIGSKMAYDEIPHRKNHFSIFPQYIFKTKILVTGLNWDSSQFHRLPWKTKAALGNPTPGKNQTTITIFIIIPIQTNNSKDHPTNIQWLVQEADTISPHQHSHQTGAFSK